MPSYLCAFLILHVTSMSLLLGDLIGLIRRHMPISLPIMQLYFGWGLRGPLRVVIMVMLGWVTSFSTRPGRGIDHDLRQHQGKNKARFSIWIACAD